MPDYFSAFKMPADTLECGYSNEICTLVVEITVTAAILCTIVLLILLFFIRQQWLNHQLVSATWWLDSDRLTVCSHNDSGAKSSSLKADSMSRHSSELPIDYVMNVLKEDVLDRPVMFEGINVAISLINQRKKIVMRDFDQQSLQILYKLKNLNVDRLNAFIGLAFNHSNQLWIVWKFEARSTLCDVLFHEEIEISEQFQVSFINDLVMVRSKY